MPKSLEQFYQQHREDAGKLEEAQQSGTPDDLSRAESDYMNHVKEAHEAGDLEKHPQIYDEARDEMESYELEKRADSILSEFSKEMPDVNLTSEQKEAAQKTLIHILNGAVNSARYHQSEFHLPERILQLGAEQKIKDELKLGHLPMAESLQKEFQIPESEEYKNWLARAEKAKLAIKEISDRRNDGIEYIDGHASKKELEEIIERIKTNNDSPMSIQISFQCPTTETVRLLEELDDVAAEKRIPVKLRMMSDCVYKDSKENIEVVAMELFLSKRWRPRIEFF